MLTCCLYDVLICNCCAGDLQAAICSVSQVVLRLAAGAVKKKITLWVTNNGKFTRVSIIDGMLNVEGTFSALQLGSYWSFLQPVLSVTLHTQWVSMPPAWQKLTQTGKTVSLICRDFFCKARVDKEGFALLDLDDIGTLGRSRQEALNLEFGKPQAPTVQCGPLGVVPLVSVKHNHLSPLGYQTNWSKRLASQRGASIQPCSRRRYLDPPMQAGGTRADVPGSYTSCGPSYALWWCIWATSRPSVRCHS